MNFSGISNRSTMGKILRQPLKLIPPGTQVRILQGTLRGKRWIAGSSNHGCWLGSYELEKQKLFEAEVQKGGVVFDVGANVGFYTMLASVLVGPSGKVFAFEPVPRNIELLKKHLRLNRISNATVIEKAVSDTNGQACFNDSTNTSMGHLDVSGGLNVLTVSIDSLISEGSVAPPNYMKIDVEGAEFLVLSGARATLIEHHPIIFLATHGAEVHQQCCELLKSLGYRLEGIGAESVTQCDELIAYAA